MRFGVVFGVATMRGRDGGERGVGLKIGGVLWAERRCGGGSGVKGTVPY